MSVAAVISDALPDGQDIRPGFFNVHVSVVTSFKLTLNNISLVHGG